MARNRVEETPPCLSVMLFPKRRRRTNSADVVELFGTSQQVRYISGNGRPNEKQREQKHGPHSVFEAENITENIHGRAFMKQLFARVLCMFGLLQHPDYRRLILAIRS